MAVGYLDGMRKAADISSHFARATAWGPFDSGMAVRVLGQPRSQFVFLAHVTNTDSGEEWIEVIGGRSGQSLRRSFATDFIKPVRRSGRGSGPSTARLF